MTLRELNFSLRKDLKAGQHAPGFGARVGQLRNRLAAAKAGCTVIDAELLSESRALLAELDERHFQTVSTRIKSQLDAQTHSDDFLQEVARLLRFVEGGRSVWEPHESISLNEAQSLLAHLESRGIVVPIRKTQTAVAPPAAKAGPKKAVTHQHVHHPTLDDDFDDEPRIMLISGGAFETNRRRH